MNSIDNLLPLIKNDFPDIQFVPGQDFHWSPRDNKITYTTHQAVAEHGVWALLHELAHATLGHFEYENDFELLKIENLAWQQAKYLAKKYHVSINSDHIQDCLDTYRDWLHNRSSCPICGVVSLQGPDKLYKCFNCKTKWKVPPSVLSKTSKKIIK
jgi:hypothetical protein